jgi:hypothetical protein
MKRIVTDVPPRLDIRPVASGYLRRVRTSLRIGALPGRIQNVPFHLEYSDFLTQTTELRIDIGALGDRGECL